MPFSSILNLIKSIGLHVFNVYDQKETLLHSFVAFFSSKNGIIPICDGRDFLCPKCERYRAPFDISNLRSITESTMHLIRV